MAAKALKDLKNLPVSERNIDYKTKLLVGKMNGTAEDKPPQNSVPFDHNHPKGDEIEKPEAERVIVEIEYIESKDLNNVTQVDAVLKSLVTELDSKDWVLVCDALNTIRRLSIFHKEEMLHMLEKVILFIVKSLKNPRSAVSKTACMTSADIFSSYNDHTIDQLDLLLTQLLLKSSQDKRFVCEAAEKALVAMTAHVSPALLLPKLQPFLKNRNPRIRAKASTCFSRCVPRLGIEGIREYGIEKLVQAASSQLSDQLPESREAARAVLLELQTVYKKTTNVEPKEEHPEPVTWQIFCQSNLSPLSAQAVIRVTNVAGVAREGLVAGS
ncbi:unknown protein [Arabidopsis thaliana]|jgi:hypothetical protein|uniref:ARM repeat superfamily protein n=3 Tax=Arabidopsis TaxID=3701 RepID=Q9SGH3_ARATH|nr:ARM repeat superfamily protein [Arabidopsis thaliana]NP_566138.1 ARM repeat superfamily protein [Arabidopsis thaliana]KAG7629630.1 HEAT type 2 [Arabidopsis suecica]AAF24615.1 unknown protein [Arabidopsis thaliana]ABF85781.1 At3g01450 [Arabidopsis thaliana]AEE73668.1 ARM repeat superfamily protein [Arabidopsis thaliana]ANM65733.1 ARM repeat superfamily protein [Arabidopsis thaliana]|eukprot:NP_001327680.1 ARM repeat superfamily protein [Arabidopsis thaliana]